MKYAAQIRGIQSRPAQALHLTGRGKNRASQGNREQGYILLTLLLVCSLMAIVAATVAVPIAFEMKREQEQEMIHRGVQYTRSIRAYYRKYNRYPTKLDDLDNTNNLRYLRKHYKDPLSCKDGKCADFKLLHYGDPGLSLAGGFGTPIQGATPAGSLNAPTGASSSAFGNSSTFGGNSSFGGNSAFGGNSSFGNSSGFGNNSAFGNSPPGSNSGFGSSGVNPNGVFAQSSGSDQPPNPGAPSPGQPGTDQSDASQPVSQTPGVQSIGGGSANQQVFGGGPIVGVASICKDKTIREFNKKTKYNEWQFIYDPTADRGGLITTPYQQGLQSFANANLNGTNGQGGTQPGTNSSPFGQSSFGQSGQSSFGQSSFGQSSFGQSSSFGNSNQNNSPPSQPPTNSPQ